MWWERLNGGGTEQWSSISIYRVCFPLLKGSDTSTERCCAALPPETGCFGARVTSCINDVVASYWPESGPPPRLSAGAVHSIRMGAHLAVQEVSKSLVEPRCASGKCVKQFWGGGFLFCRVRHFGNKEFPVVSTETETRVRRSFDDLPGSVTHWGCKRTLTLPCTELGPPVSSVHVCLFPSSVQRHPAEQKEKRENER